MKRQLQRALCACPRQFGALLRLLRRGSLEKRVFLALLARGDVVADVGANEGHFTALFSDIVGAAGHVHAFEPVPGTFARLEQRMKSARGSANFTLNHCALPDAPGETTIFLPGSDHGQASLRQHHSGSWSGAAPVAGFPCRVETFSDYMRDTRRLDFVKCDIEGAELLFLRGARGALQRLAPMLFLEVCAAWTASFGYTPADLLEELRACGYDTFRVVGSKVEPLAAHDFSASTNLLCARAALHTEKLARADRA